MPVALVSCPDLNGEDIREILALVLGEFPIKELRFKLPEWTMVLPGEHHLRKRMLESINSFTDETRKIGDISAALKKESGISCKALAVAERQQPSICCCGILMQLMALFLLMDRTSMLLTAHMGL